MDDINNNELREAERIISLGWPIAPIAPKAKHPAIKAWVETASDDLDEVRTWFEGAFKGCGIGIVTGQRSGIVVVDVDVKDDGPANLAELVDTDDGLMPPTVTAHTGSGGFHFYYAYDPDRPLSNSHGQVCQGVDIRGDGGQVLAPPTIHPNGEPYRWADDRSPWDIDVAPMPEFVYEAIERGGEGVEQVDTGASIPLSSLIGSNAPSSPDGPTPAEFFREVTDFEAMLSIDGWTEYRRQGDELHLVRPGKSARDGMSAVLHRNEVLVIFTTSIPQSLQKMGRPVVDGSGLAFSAFDYYTGTRHDGDHTEAARTVRGTMPGAPAQPAPSPPSTSDQLSKLLGRPVEIEEGGIRWVTPDEMREWVEGSAVTNPCDMLMRTDGVGLMYVDALNWVHGDSGSGKTWVALTAAAEMLNNDETVAWLHYEDPNPSTIVGRLLALGVDPEAIIERFHYLDADGWPFYANQWNDHFTEHGVKHLFLDSVGEALNAASVSPDKDAEVGPWITYHLKRVLGLGIGVTVIDHATKSRERILYPSGSMRKRAAVTGISLYVEAIMAPTVGRKGLMKLVVGKDRLGNHQQGETVGYFHMYPAQLGEPIRVVIDLNGPPPETDEDEEEDPRLTWTIYEYVLEQIADEDGRLTGNMLAGLVKGRRTVTMETIADAVEVGHVERRSSLVNEPDRLWITDAGRAHLQQRGWE